MQTYNLTRLWIGLAAAGLLALLVLAEPAASGEEVTFDSAVYPPTAFKTERAKRDGVVLTPQAAERISGRLSRPLGAGPFPAVVMLHGCGGRWRWNDVWSERLVAWGYVVLDVDSFGPRGLPDGVCGNNKLAARASAVTRARDAHGAKRYLSRLTFVDPARIAVFGMSRGGTSTLQAAHARTTRKVGSTPFRAAIAFYPVCDSNIEPDAPILVLIGALDNWTPPDSCERFEAALAERHDVTVIIYPGSHHVFDMDGIDRRFRNFYVLRSNPEAARDAERRVKAFLARHL